MTKNFLNNQNYILGKNEKKKLLSKFFIENNILFFLNIIYKIQYIFARKFEKSNYGRDKKEKGKFLLILFLIYYFLSVYYFQFIMSGSIYFIFGIILNFIYGFYLFLFSIKLYNPYYKNNSKFNKLLSISEINNIIISKKPSILYTIIKVFSWFMPFFFVGFVYFKLYIFSLISILYFLLGKYGLEILKKIFRIKFLLIILFPILLIMEILFLIYYYLKILIFNLKSKFTIHKLTYNKKLVNYFDILDKNYAENEYYIIQLK